MADTFLKRRVKDLITDKRKLLIILIIIITAATLLISCGKKNDDLYNNLFTTGENYEKSQNNAEIRVIVADDASGEIFGSAEALARNIEERIGCEMTVCFANKSEEKSDLDILVGTACENSYAVMKNYRYNDYGFTRKDGNIYICGLNDEAVSNAIAKFSEKISGISKVEDLLNFNDEYYNKSQREIESSHLCGFELSNYTVVYSKDDVVSKELAFSLRKELFAKTGYLLAVVDDTVANSGLRAISVGNTKLYSEKNEQPKDSYTILEYSTGTAVLYDSEICGESACFSLVDLLSTADGEKKAKLELPQPIRINLEPANIKFLRFDLLGKSPEVVDIISISQLCLEKEADLILIENGTAERNEYILENLGSSYTCVISAENDCYIYNVNTLRYLDFLGGDYPGFGGHGLVFADKETECVFSLCKLTSYSEDSVGVTERAAEWVDAFEVDTVLLCGLSENALFQLETELDVSNNFETILNKDDSSASTLGRGISLEICDILNANYGDVWNILVSLYKIKS